MTLPERALPLADVVTRRLGDEMVLLNLSSGTYFALNEVGARIWELIKEGVPPPQMIQPLLDEFETDALVLEADLGRLLADLQAHGLIGTT